MSNGRDEGEPGVDELRADLRHLLELDRLGLLDRHLDLGHLAPHRRRGRAGAPGRLVRGEPTLDEQRVDLLVEGGERIRVVRERRRGNEENQQTDPVARLHAADQSTERATAPDRRRRFVWVSCRVGVQRAVTFRDRGRNISIAKSRNRLDSSHGDIALMRLTVARCLQRKSA